MNLRILFLVGLIGVSTVTAKKTLEEEFRDLYATSGGQEADYNHRKQIFIEETKMRYRSRAYELLYNIDKEFEKYDKDSASKKNVLSPYDRLNQPRSFFKMIINVCRGRYGSTRPMCGPITFSEYGHYYRSADIVPILEEAFDVIEKNAPVNDGKTISKKNLPRVRQYVHMLYAKEAAALECWHNPRYVVPITAAVTIGACYGLYVLMAPKVIADTAGTKVSETLETAVGALTTQVVTMKEVVDQLHATIMNLVGNRLQPNPNSLMYANR